MKRPKTLTRVAALAGAVVLTAAACGSDDDTGGGESGGGVINADLTQPQAIYPTDTTESEGSTIVENIYSKLVNFDPETGDLEHYVAESVETEDGVVWDIAIEDGWEFHNGEPVDADAFIRAWNYGAYGPNAQRGNFFFETIEGYDAMQGDEPEAEELAGLEKVDDLNFQVTLSEPFQTFEVALGHNAFLPMAQECLDDTDACDERPIGNGPFEMADDWEHDVQIALERWEDYPGENSANIDELNFHIYADNNTAYNELTAGNLDIVRTTPPELREDAREQFGDRFIEEETSSVTKLAYPIYDEKFEDPLIRQALSLAIDREAIIENVLLDAYEPADSFIPPVIPGYQGGEACEFCQYDPERAQELLEEAGGWPEGEPLEFNFQPGAGHDEWMEAVGNEIQNNLGIDFELNNELEWEAHLQARDDEEMDGPYRSAWIMSYPSQEYYLKPLYTENGSSADTGFYNEDFESLVREGDAADDLDEAVERYAEAEQILFDEVPAIPLFFGMSATAYNSNVENVTYNVYETNPVWTELTVS